MCLSASSVFSIEWVTSDYRFGDGCYLGWLFSLVPRGGTTVTVSGVRVFLFVLLLCFSVFFSALPVVFTG